MEAFAGAGKSFVFGDTAESNQNTLQEKCQTLENQLENVTTERDSLAKAVTKSQTDIVELRTQLNMEQQSLKKLQASLSKKEDLFQIQLKDHKETINSLTERLRVAPVLDEAITSLYVEVRMTLQLRSQAPVLYREEKDALPRTSPLVVLEKLRTWVRKILHQPQRAASRAQSAGGSGSDPNATSSQCGSPSVPKTRAGGRRGSATSPGKSETQLSRAETVLSTMLSEHRGEEDSPEAMLSELVGRLQSENDELNDQVDALQEALATVRKEAAATEQQCRTLADLARRDAAQAKAECKKKEFRIEKLQQEVVERKQNADMQQQLARTHHSTESTKKDLRNLLDAKKQEISNLRRQHDDETRDMRSRLNYLERQRTGASLLNHELAEQKEKTESIRAQMVRSNIPGLVKEKNRVTTLAKTQEQKIQSLEVKLQGQQGIMQHLDQTNKKMTEQYNVIFEAHVRERELEQSRRQKVRHAAITKATIGPDSEMTVAHYRERYYEVLEELKKSQGKMKQLLLFAQHDHIAYAKHTAHTENDLAEVEAERDQLHVRTSNLVNALHSMQSSGFNTPEDEDSGSRVGVGKTDEENALLFGEREDASTTLMTPSVRVAPDSTVIDVSVPSSGESRTPFGGPLDDSEILRLRTSVPNSHEASLRALSDMVTRTDAPEGTSQEVLSRRPKRKVPGVGSTRGKKFDFTTVGKSRFNTSAIASMVRPKSANPDLSF